MTLTRAAPRRALHGMKHRWCAACQSLPTRVPSSKRDRLTKSTDHARTRGSCVCSDARDCRVSDYALYTHTREEIKERRKKKQTLFTSYISVSRVFIAVALVVCRSPFSCVWSAAPNTCHGRIFEWFFCRFPFFNPLCSFLVQDRTGFQSTIRDNFIWQKSICIMEKNVLFLPRSLVKRKIWDFNVRILKIVWNVQKSDFF